jgi:hypothetical protein
MVTHLETEEVGVGVEDQPLVRQALASVFFGADAKRPDTLATFVAGAVAADADRRAASAAGYTHVQWRHDGTPAEPRRAHLLLDGVTVPMGDVFPGTTCRVPRDPDGAIEDTANCTCSCWYVRFRASEAVRKLPLLSPLGPESNRAPN